MKGLARFLEKEGYKVLNLDYPSSRHSIENIAELIHAPIKEFANQINALHFVGYSMGGLVIRAYLTKYRPTILNRVIMLGTPNQGSEISDFLKDNWIYKKLYGPAGQQLITDQTEFKDIFGQVDYELGVIAGESTFYWLGSKIINKLSDGRVAISNTHLDGLKELIVIKSGHTLLPNNKQAWEHTLSFLKHGKFIP
jgi:triacylglycerol esterase/lipase EstA (alpha/beta hydrolase family)